MKKLVVIDGNALLYRAFYAYPPFESPKGELVGAVYGFTTLLFSVIEKLSPTHMVVAWDVKAPTFRKEKYDQYKAQRAPMDENLVVQIERTKEVVESLNIPQFEKSGFEADDIIGTISVLAFKDEQNNEDVQVVIVTGDRDALQLVRGKKVVVYLPIQNKYAKSAVFDEEKVKEVYGIEPKQIVDLKGLMGDASDNIPGVKGVGKVSATRLITDFGSINEVYKRIDDNRISNKVRTLLVAGEDMAMKSRELAEIHCKVPISFTWKKCLLSDYDRSKAENLFETLGFRSLLSKLPEGSYEKDVVDIFI